MPELPEVQTVKMVLNNSIKGKEIKKIDIYFNKILKNITKTEFKEKLEGKIVQEVKRKGKYLILRIRPYSLLIHLRMEGKLFYYPDNQEKTKHDHIKFTFTDNTVLMYNDVRKFGTFDLILQEEESNYNKLIKLGIEPFTKEFTYQNLFQKLEKSNRKIKMDLLDQHKVSGLGNIYADEVLYACKIHPEQISHTLTKQQIKDIIKYSEIILQEAIDNKGTTIKSFSTSNESKGGYQDFLKVYFKKGEKCSRCHDIIEKIKVGGRGTHFCPTCQRLR